MIAWFKWFFSDSGIMMVPERSGSPLVEYLKYYKLKAYNCRICGVGAWKRSGKKTAICKKFSCFKANGSKWA